MGDGRPRARPRPAQLAPGAQAHLQGDSVAEKCNYSLIGRCSLTQSPEVILAESHIDFTPRTVPGSRLNFTECSRAARPPHCTVRQGASAPPPYVHCTVAQSGSHFLCGSAVLRPRAYKQRPTMASSVVHASNKARKPQGPPNTHQRRVRGRTRGIPLARGKVVARENDRYTPRAPLRRPTRVSVCTYHPWALSTVMSTLSVCWCACGRRDHGVAGLNGCVRALSRRRPQRATPSQGSVRCRSARHRCGGSWKSSAALARALVRART